MSLVVGFLEKLKQPVYFLTWNSDAVIDNLYLEIDWTLPMKDADRKPQF